MPVNPPTNAAPRWPRLGTRRPASPVVGTIPPPPIDIPICWLSGSVSLRLDKPINFAAVTQYGKATATKTHTASIDEVGSQPFTATLYTPITADAANLATWTIAYRLTPRMRAPSLTVDLMYRTDDERILLRRIERNQRIRLTGVPAEFPEGASSLVVSGLTHEIGYATRRLTFTTAYVLGANPGIPGPWFRTDVSATDGTHVVPY